MLNNIYVDTNIIVDICDIKRPAHKKSLDKIYQYLESGELFINSDSLSTLFYILRSSAKLSFKEAIEKIYFVHSIFNVVAIDEKISFNALELCTQEICTDYEDAMQYVCAKKVNADVIVTNDKKFVSKDIKIVTTV